MRREIGLPKIVDRATFHAELEHLRVREKAHSREGDVIAAARRRLPMVEVNGATALTGERGKVTLLDAFKRRRMLIAYFMWSTGKPASGQVRGVHLGYIAGARALIHPFSQCRVRRLLPGPVRTKRPVPQPHGLGDALVLSRRLLPRSTAYRPPRGQDAHRYRGPVSLEDV